MFRAVLEILITIGVVLIARTVLTHLMRSITAASRNAYQQTMDEAERRNRATESAANPSTGQLHKDPVCGTYVAESTPFRRQLSGDTFYYCSNRCREVHTPVAR